MTSLRIDSVNAMALGIETKEDLICHLRIEAQKHLAAVPRGNDDLVEACPYVFKILALQDKICQDRHRISVLRK
jgi:hypothetical protein